MSRTEIPTQEGVLITSDEQSIVYLKCLNDGLEKSKRFITLFLNSTNLLIKAESMEMVYTSLQGRLVGTVWDEEGEASAEKAEAEKREKRARR